MAVKDESLHRATEELILSSPRKYYRASPPTREIHWQLRSLICSPEPNIVYYPHDSDIICLDTRNREREIVTRITFPLQCLAVAKDWLCAGGEAGSYTCIRLNETSPTTEDLAADARLPLDLELPRRTSSQDAQLRLPRLQRVPRPIPAPVAQFGKEINNCITLWFPRDDKSELAYEAPVAVLSNNDSKVRILYLGTSELIETLEFPTSVNRSIISPDGSMLASVCDDPYLHIHRRILKPESKRKKKMPDSEWSLAERIPLEGQSEADKTITRGSFAVCFSKSGQYLAAATQYGVISVFDTQEMGGLSQPIVIFTNSRPGQKSGAVRSMEFCPGPFDLLAWTEANNRAGIADIRTSFLSRQLLLLDSRSNNVERVSVTERPGTGIVDPRLRDPPRNTLTSFLNSGGESGPPFIPRSNMPTYLRMVRELAQHPNNPLTRASDDSEDRDIQPSRTLRNNMSELLGMEHGRSSSNSTPDYLGLGQLTREMLDRTPTREEMAVLDASGFYRRQRDAAAATREGLAESSSSSRPESTAERTGGTTQNGSRASDTTDLPSALREFMNPDRTTTSLRSFINDRTRESERRSNPPHEPRRRSSMILASAEDAIERERYTIGALRSRAEQIMAQPYTPPPYPIARRVRPDQRSLSPYGEGPPIRASQDPDTLDFSDIPSRIELEGSDSIIFARAIRQPWQQFQRQNNLGNEDLLRRLDASNVETLGACWSTDGRTLYVGADNGLYEFNVNIPNRKVFPSLVLR